MKKLTYLTALVPVAAVAVLYLNSGGGDQHSPSQGSPNPSKSISINIPRASASNLAVVAIEKHQSETEAFNARMVERESADADFAASLDMNQQYAALERRLAKDEPAYRRLFSEWGLSNEDEAEVLSTIRKREIMLLDSLVESYQNTSKENGDRSDPAKVAARSKKTAEGYATAKLFASTQLLPLLGAKRFQQLAEAEDRIRKNRSTSSKG